MIEVSSPERVLWPLTGFTKGEMLDYYDRVAPVILPHLKDRPLTLGRFPAGVGERGFAQLECRGRPPWVQTAALRLRDGRTRRACLAQDRESLLWIANLNAIELHVFLGTAAALDQPTALLFDLDPEPPAGIAEVARVALALGARLEERGLLAVAKTTGGSGLHVLVPLNAAHDYQRTRAFARRLAQEVAADHDNVVTAATRRNERAGTVLVDWAQNAERRSMIAPYSLRSAPVPSVATPVTWSEVASLVHDLWFSPHEVLERVERHGDLLAPVLTTVQRI